MKSNRTSNGYILVYKPDHPKSMKGGNWDGYIYEHILVGESVVDRQIKEGEEIHHLDTNRSNNSPDNILVLSGPMHMKLHNWLNKNIITPKPEYDERTKLGCVRCKTCNTPINPNLTFCSATCSQHDSKKYERPSKEELDILLWSKPTTEIAKDLNVSDTAIKKLAKQLGISKPPPGFWNKVKANKICLLK